MKNRKADITQASSWKQLVGDRLSGARVAGLAAGLHHDGQGIAEICALMLGNGNARASYNAAWILTHLSREDKDLYLFPMIDRLIDFALSPERHAHRGLFFSILSDFTRLPENRTDLLDFCMSHLADTDMSHSSRSYMIKIAARLCSPYPELVNELLLCLELLPPGQPPSITCVKRRVMKELTKTQRKRQVPSITSKKIQ